MSVSNSSNKQNSTEGLEMEGVQDKRTRFQVNRVKNESPDKNGPDSVINMSNDDDTDEDNDNLLSDRTRLNSETDTKNFKSFR